MTSRSACIDMSCRPSSVLSILNLCLIPWSPSPHTCPSSATNLAQAAGSSGRERLAVPDREIHFSKHGELLHTPCAEIVPCPEGMMEIILKTDTGWDTAHVSPSDDVHTQIREAIGALGDGQGWEGAIPGSLHEGHEGTRDEEQGMR